MWRGNPPHDAVRAGRNGGIAMACGTKKGGGKKPPKK